jgi:GTP-binding protein EngB required for normal cell division
MFVKICLLGKTSVGKTTLISCLVNKPVGEIKRKSSTFNYCGYGENIMTDYSNVIKMENVPQHNLNKFNTIIYDSIGFENNTTNVNIYKSLEQELDLSIVVIDGHTDFGTNENDKAMLNIINDKMLTLYVINKIDDVNDEELIANVDDIKKFLLNNKYIKSPDEVVCIGGNSIYQKKFKSDLGELYVSEELNNLKNKINNIINSNLQEIINNKINKTLENPKSIKDLVNTYDGIYTMCKDTVVLDHSRSYYLFKIKFNNINTYNLFKDIKDVLHTLDSNIVEYLVDKYYRIKKTEDFYELFGYNDIALQRMIICIIRDIDYYDDNYSGIFEMLKHIKILHTNTDIIKLFNDNLSKIIYHVFNDTYTYLQYNEKTILAWLSLKANMIHSHKFNLLTVTNKLFINDCNDYLFENDNIDYMYKYLFESISYLSKFNNINTTVCNDISNNDDCYINSVKLNNITLEFIPHNMKTLELCLLAIKQNDNILYFPKELLTQEICMNYINMNPLMLENIPIEFITYEMCMKAIELNGNTLLYIPSKFKTYELCNRAIKENKYENHVLNFVPNRFKTNEFCNIALKADYHNYLYLPEHFKNINNCVEVNPYIILLLPTNIITYELCMKVVRLNGLVLEFIPQEFKTKDLCNVALKSNKDAINYVPESVRQ